MKQAPVAVTGCAVLVFAKAPVAGFAKTRLAPALGVAGAARLAERLLERAVAAACAAELGAVRLCCAPDTSHPAFQKLTQAHEVTLVDQGEGELGARMHRALARILRTADRALLIGTDACGLDAAYLRLAADALDDHDAVYGPALDGGYVLVGLRRAEAGLFEGIAWSTPQVMRETRERLASLGLTHVELLPLADVDEPADLQHLPQDWLAA